MIAITEVDWRERATAVFTSNAVVENVMAVVSSLNATGMYLVSPIAWDVGLIIYLHIWNANWVAFIQSVFFRFLCATFRCSSCVSFFFTVASCTFYVSVHFWNCWPLVKWSEGCHCSFHVIISMNRVSTERWILIRMELVEEQVVDFNDLVPAPTEGNTPELSSEDDSQTHTETLPHSRPERSKSRSRSSSPPKGKHITLPLVLLERYRFFVFFFNFNFCSATCHLRSPVAFINLLLRSLAFFQWDQWVWFALETELLETMTVIICW